jgi:hypothetical protein
LDSYYFGGEFDFCRNFLLQSLMAVESVMGRTVSGLEKGQRCRQEIS